MSQRESSKEPTAFRGRRRVWLISWVWPCNLSNSPSRNRSLRVASIASFVSADLTIEWHWTDVCPVVRIWPDSFRCSAARTTTSPGRYRRFCAFRTFRPALGPRWHQSTWVWPGCWIRGSCLPECSCKRTRGMTGTCWRTAASESPSTETRNNRLECVFRQGLSFQECPPTIRLKSTALSQVHQHSDLLKLPTIFEQLSVTWLTLFKCQWLWWSSNANLFVWAIWSRKPRASWQHASEQHNCKSVWIARVAPFNWIVFRFDKSFTTQGADLASLFVGCWNAARKSKSPLQLVVLGISAILSLFTLFSKKLGKKEKGKN